MEQSRDMLIVVLVTWLGTGVTKKGHKNNHSLSSAIPLQCQCRHGSNSPYFEVSVSRSIAADLAIFCNKVFSSKLQTLPLLYSVQYRRVSNARHPAADQLVLDLVHVHLLGVGHLVQKLAPRRETEAWHSSEMMEAS